MQKSVSLFFGSILIFMGLLALGINFGLPLVGLHFAGWFAARFWPVTVIGAGLAFCGLPLVLFRQRWPGSLFIPGLPILATGGILMLTNTLQAWWLWEILWPAIVIALAAGFALAAVFMRVYWLIIPAILIGANALVLQFCAVTGLWESWAVLWAVEPLAVGLSLLAVEYKARTGVLIFVAAGFCTFAGLALFGLTSILVFGGWFFRLAGPATLILAGLIVLLFGLAGRHLARPAAA